MSGTDVLTCTFLPYAAQDEAKERRKQILSSIGEDLLLAANDQPFRFPATFTFVVRSFTVSAPRPHPPEVCARTPQLTGEHDGARCMGHLVLGARVQFECGTRQGPWLRVH